MGGFHLHGSADPAMSIRSSTTVPADAAMSIIDAMRHRDCGLPMRRRADGYCDHIQRRGPDNAVSQQRKFCRAARCAGKRQIWCAPTAAAHSTAVGNTSALTTNSIGFSALRLSFPIWLYVTSNLCGYLVATILGTTTRVSS